MRAHCECCGRPGGECCERTGTCCESREPEHPASSAPLFPPPWFVTRYNAANPGLWRGSLDPMVMYAWHLASRPAPQPMVLITGC